MECVLQPCKDKNGKLIKLTKKGLERIVECSNIRQDGVKDAFQNNVDIQVHAKCRKKYTRNPQPPSIDDAPASRLQCRSPFDFKTLCFLCGRKCMDISKCRNKSQEKWSLVEKKELINSIRDCAIKRQCAWGEEVLLRLSGLSDLIHPDGRYHVYCYSRFKVKGSTKPGEAAARGGSTGDEERVVAFEKLCQYLENNDECQYTSKELQNLFCSLNPGIDSYSDTHLRRKLVQRYGRSIYIADLPGKHTVICFTGTASHILSDTWYKNRNINESQEEMRLIKTAAAIIRREIKCQSYDCSQFPTVDQISYENSNELIPELLKVLIYEIIKPKTQTTQKEKVIERKTISIGHAIISAARPRSFVSPVQLGTAVSFHRKFGSKLLIDILANMGLCVSYSEVLKYERSVTSEEKTKIDGGYVQFVFDNADYNVHTVDGHNTFHAMGGVVCVTPRSSFLLDTAVPRKNIPACAVENCGLTLLQTYRAPSTSGYSTIVALDMQDIQVSRSSAVTHRTLDLFWLAGIWLDGPCPRPGWSGCMEKLYAEEKYQTTAVIALPFINLTPSNPSTIYTALLYAAEKGSENGQLCTMVTFDQPLYAKAREIVANASPENPLKSLFIRLGGFHLLLSFLGAIGHVMAGSGLEELWSTVYAKNSVVQMMNGKAYSRAIRALYLTQEALLTVFIEMQVLHLNKNELKVIYSSFISGDIGPDEICNSNAVTNFVKILEEQLQNSKESGRTQRLWIQFIEMVEIIRLFVKAERSGNFHLHLYCVHQMLPIFHATGHLNYVKSAHVYLQDSLQLFHTLCDEEYEKFIRSGYFTIRRSEKFWSGIWTDLTIEQVLMKDMKSSGGLTGGRGISASTIATWVNSMPTCSRIVEAVEKFAGVEAISSEQHVELREGNQKRNAKDLQCFIAWIREHNPFSKPPKLSSLSTGVVADENINCDEAFEIGAIALKEIAGKKFSDIRLKRKYAVKSLASITKSITIREDTVCVNPNQLLHRMVCIVRKEEQLADVLKHELCAYPPSLFDEAGLMRKGNKSSMVQVLAPKDSESSTNIQNSVGTSYIVDGGYLLHRVMWQRPATFQTICQQYTGYVVSQFEKATVVFDGYSEGGTKDEEHLRRSNHITHVDVRVENGIHVTMAQGEFLSNIKNKVQLISLLTKHLQEAGCKVLQADGDADTLIVSTAIGESEKGVEAIVIGNDTDLLVLLTSLAPQNNLLKMMMPNINSQEEKVYVIQDIQCEIGELKDILLTVYAFTGCDTVSSIYRKGKIKPYQKVQTDRELQNKLQIFNRCNAQADAIAEAGEHFFLCLYGCKKADNLDSVRYQLYLQKIAKHPVHSQFKLAVLPPTSAAAREHSLRVYHQVQQWHGIRKDPQAWGWKKVAGYMRPITTCKAAAPEELLCLIACTCSEGCIRNCECRRSALKCSSMCTNCAGHGCSNRDPAEDLDLGEDNFDNEDKDTFDDTDWTTDD